MQCWHGPRVKYCTESILREFSWNATVHRRPILQRSGRIPHLTVLMGEEGGVLISILQIGVLRLGSLQTTEAKHRGGTEIQEEGHPAPGLPEITFSLS